MESRLSKWPLRAFAAFLLAAGLFGVVVAQNLDPDPNSPTPIILTQDSSVRALAREAGQKDRRVAKPEDRGFARGSQVTIYVTNLSLMAGEGANAFRVYAQDSLGRTYRFPVTGLERISREIYTITFRLSDEIGYWPEPGSDGDVFLYLTWRGLASNRVRLGYGGIEGALKNSLRDRPAPLSLATDQKKRKAFLESIAPEYVGYRWSGDRMRFLEQATFGPTSALDARVRRIGPRTWLAEQFEMPYPSGTNPYPLFPPKPLNIGQDPLCDGGADDNPPNCGRDAYTMYLPTTWFFREAYYGDAQLRHRVTWALNQIWVTAAPEVQQGRHMVEFHKILSSNAFGNYRELMRQVTLNPAMGQYLDMAISTRNNPNENYARELMQLFSIGLFMLNPDGTYRCVEHNPCQPGDTLIPTYDQNVVNNLTKVLTGWGFCNVTTSCPNHIPSQGIINYIDPLLLVRNNHDLTAKTLLTYDGAVNTNIPACTGCTGTAIDTYAANSMQQALDNIYNHPNVGPFVSRILIQHLVTSDPSPAYVGRVAAVFNENRTSPTQLKEVVKAILLDPEARGDVKTDPNFGKLREPVLYNTNFSRAFGVRAADGVNPTDGYVYARGEFSGMGQVPFLSPTVFNFYPPDYVIPGTSLLGPEFAIMTTGTAVQRTNWVNRMTFTAIPIPVANPNAPSGTAYNFSDLQAISAADATGNLLLDELNHRMLHGTMTTQMRNTILPAVTAVTATDTLGRVRQAVYLIATSSQFQVQR